jgi:hypothetical protein
VPRRRVEVPLEPHRAWVWAVDAEWRWRRAVRLLLQVHLAATAADGHGGPQEELAAVASTGLLRPLDAHLRGDRALALGDFHPACGGAKCRPPP